MSVHILPSLAAIPPYVFSELERRKTVARAAGHEFIDLGIGSPDQKTPAAILEALRVAAIRKRDQSLSAVPRERAAPQLGRALHGESLRRGVRTTA